MLDRAREQRLQLLLSWRRKALTAAADTPFDRKTYATFDDFRAEQLRLAAERLDAFRGEIRGEIDRIATRRNALRREQQALPVAVQSGKLSPVDANRRNRKLREHIEECEAGIARCNMMAAAEDPEEAGAFVDLPLERYAARIGAATPKRARGPVMRVLGDNRVQAALGCIGVVLAVLSVLYLTRWRNEVVFEAGPDQPPAHLRLVCENRTLSTILFHAPWLDGRPGADAGPVLRRRGFRGRRARRA